MTPIFWSEAWGSPPRPKESGTPLGELQGNESAVHLIKEPSVSLELLRVLHLLWVQIEGFGRHWAWCGTVAGSVVVIPAFINKESHIFILPRVSQIM